MKLIHKLILTALFLLLSCAAFGQRNLYVKQLSADSIKARVDTLNFPYNFSGPFNVSTPTIAVNDTLLHLWVQNQGGGGAVIPSNPNEILQNVAGTNQGQPNLLYNAANSNLQFGTLNTVTATDLNNLFLNGNSNNITGAGVINENIVLGFNHTLNAVQASPTVTITDNVAIGSNYTFISNDAAVQTSTITNCVGIGGTMNSFEAGVIESINNAVIIGGNNLSFEAASNGSVLIGGSTVDVPNGAGNFVTAIALQNFTIPTAVSNTAFLPRLRIGSGLNATIPDGSNADRIIGLNTTNGELQQLLANTVPVATASPGAGQDGQVLQWNNGTTTWEYATPGGAFWPLSGTGTVTANNIIESTGATTISIRNQDAANDRAAITFQEFGADKNFVIATQSPTDVSSISTLPGSLQLTVGTTAANTGGQLTISQGVNAFQFVDYATVRKGIQYDQVYLYTNLNDQSLTQKRHVDSLLTVAGDEITFSQTITSAQILAGNTTPIQLVAAPGANAMVQITSPITFYLVFGTTAYATNTTADIIYNGGSQLSSANAILAAANDVIDIEPVSVPQTTATNVLNRAVEFQVNTGDPTLGDGELVINFSYRIQQF